MWDNKYFDWFLVWVCSFLNNNNDLSIWNGSDSYKKTMTWLKPTCHQIWQLYPDFLSERKNSALLILSVMQQHSVFCIGFFFFCVISTRSRSWGGGGGFTGDVMRLMFYQSHPSRTNKKLPSKDDMLTHFTALLRLKTCCADSRSGCNFLMILLTWTCFTSFSLWVETNTRKLTVVSASRMTIHVLHISELTVTSIWSLDLCQQSAGTYMQRPLLFLN